MYALTIIIICAFKLNGTEEDFRDDDLAKFQATAIVVYSLLCVGIFVALIMLRHYLKEKSAIF